MQRRLCLRQRGFNSLPACRHPLDIAVDHNSTATKGNGSDCRRRIRADPGQGPQAGLSIRKMPVMLFGHRDRRSVQIPRPGVIAQPRPCRQHIISRGGRQRPDIGPAADKSIKIGFDRGHRCLLQHDFRKPDSIGISMASHRRPPRQDTAMGFIP